MTVEGIGILLQESALTDVLNRGGPSLVVQSDPNAASFYRTCGGAKWRVGDPPVFLVVTCRCSTSHQSQSRISPDQAAGGPVTAHVEVIVSPVRAVTGKELRISGKIERRLPGRSLAVRSQRTARYHVRRTKTVKRRTQVRACRWLLLYRRELNSSATRYRGTRYEATPGTNRPS